MKEKFEVNYKELTDQDFKYQINSTIGKIKNIYTFQVEETPKLNLT
jgi:hypothetical protein